MGRGEEGVGDQLDDEDDHDGGFDFLAQVRRGSEISLLMRMITRGKGGSLASARKGGNPAFEASLVEVQEGARSAKLSRPKGLLGN